MELCLRPEDIYKMAFIYTGGKIVPGKVNDSHSLDI